MKDEENIPKTNPDEIEALIKRVESYQLPSDDKDLITRLLRMWLVILRLMDKPKIRLDKVKQMLFGKRGGKQSKRESEKSTASAGQSTASASASESAAEPSQAKQSAATDSQAAGEVKNKRRGHGRIPTSAYTAARIVNCIDPSRQAGAACQRQGCLGRLYDPDEVHKFIRFEARPFIEGTLYLQQVLRCGQCGARFSAPLPAGVKPEKFDETADAAIVIYRYGAGLPNYRMEKLQQMNGIPLPAATQYERCAHVADLVYPVVVELARQAAQAELLQGDDTGVVILSLVKENKTLPAKARVGMQTTGIKAKLGEQQIALYYSGRRHTGENLHKLLQERQQELALPKVMGDAAAKNFSPAFKCIVLNCLQHARQYFVDVKEAFREYCERVLKDFAQVYKNDDDTRAMSDEQRLAYHQQHSEPIITALKQYLTELLNTHKVEANDGLGQAIKYFHRHYFELTQFLRVPGAPLDNSASERMLKRAVLHRKNSLFFKTENGSLTADTIMSLIETCRLNNTNLFDYLVTLLRNARAVRGAPHQWLPWNYRNNSIVKQAI